MAYYSAHYGSWNDPEGVQRIEFGRELGIPYLYTTNNCREAFQRAQEVATQTGKVVTILINQPTGTGISGTSKKVYPVRSKIRFVRYYKQYREEFYEVIYHSGRTAEYIWPELPETVRKFVDTADIREEVFDKTFGRTEMIYH